MGLMFYMNEYEAAVNAASVIMCVNCYNNYKYAQEALDEMPIN